MKIKDVTRQIQNAEYYMKVGTEIAVAFPDLKKLGVGSQFSDPAEALKNTLNWIWLHYHSGTPSTHVQPTVDAVVARALKVYDSNPGEMLRAQHDFLLLACSAFSSKVENLNKAIEKVREADASKTGGQYYESITGMLKFRLLGDDKRTQEQLEHLFRCKGKEPILRAPKRAFIQAFVARELKTMERECKRTAKEFWKGFEERVSAVKSTDGSITLGVWDPNRFWLWPECVMIKLTKACDQKIETDPFWLPNDLIQQMSVVSKP